ncbi:TetR/AcrR family transcriptional regulator [Streptomyces altiplanensis]
MEQAAERAGVSRVLLYRHFPEKRELFAAFYEQVAGQLLTRSRADPSETLEEQLTEGLDAHIEYFAENLNTVLAANRGPVGDRVIQTIISDEPDALRERLPGALPASQGASGSRCRPC